MTSKASEPVFNNFYTPDNETVYAENLYQPLHPPETLGLRYECITYRADDPTDSLQIEVNGHPFNAFASLGVALRKLLLPDRSRVIWAEQICINQRHILERSGQVSKMRTFYENPECVSAWLDVLSGGEIAFHALQALREEYNDTLSDYTRNLPKSHKVMPIDLLSIERSVADGVLKELLSDDQDWPELVARYEVLGNIFRPELWTCMWVWQEIIFAKSVYLEWDTYTVKYDDLLIIGRILELLLETEWTKPRPKRLTSLISSPTMSNTPPSKVVNIVVLLQARRHSWQQRKVLDLKDLLDAARKARSTDRRDKVFPLCGLIDPAYNIVPDYNETIVQTYCKTAAAIMQREQSDILAYCRHPRVADASRILTTWCPDWSLKPDMINRRQNMLWDDVSSITCTFQASTGTRGSFTVTAGSLFAQGLLMGTVQNIGSLAEASQQSNEEEFDSLLNSWSQLFGEQTTTTEELRRRLECTATIDDRGYPKFSVPRNLVDASNYGRLKCNVVEGNGRFFMAKNGLMGMAPPHVEVDDLVCVLPGARVPFLLRRGDGFYTLVGEVYVSNSCMYGTAISDMRAGKMQVQDFEIR